MTNLQTRLDPLIINKCQLRLETLKEDLHTRLSYLDEEMQVSLVGDEGDMADSLYRQHNSMSQREQLLRRLKDVADALSRIHHGSFGICEDTEELIEAERLLAIPWTRLSVDGAANHESRSKSRRY